MVAIVPGTRTLDVDVLADEVAFWSRQVARDPRISAEAKTEIARLFAAGLALARTAMMPKIGRVDPGATERTRRAIIMGFGEPVR